MQMGNKPGMLLRRRALMCSHLLCSLFKASSSGKYSRHDAGGVSLVLIQSNCLPFFNAKLRACKFPNVHTALLKGVRKIAVSNPWTGSCNSSRRDKIRHLRAFSVKHGLQVSMEASGEHVHGDAGASLWLYQNLMLPWRIGIVGKPCNQL